MKINVSVDLEVFKNQVETLRKKLNECQTNGILDENFEKQLEKLAQIEEELLTELIPYYRVYVDNIKKTSMKINSIKQLGAFDFDGFLEITSRINENLFITSSVDRSVQFFCIYNFDSAETEVEWSPPIKEIKERISFIYRLNDKEILLFGTRGGCYLISIDNYKQILEIEGQIKVKKIKIDYDFKGFGRCLAINDDLFVVESGEEKLNLFEIIKEKHEYQLIFHKYIYCSVPNWATMEKISDNYFVVGTKSGRLYFIKYENKQFIITEEIDALNDEIRKIKFLENEDGKKDSIIIIGNRGQLKIFSLFEDVKYIKMELDDLEGNLFDIESKKGKAIVLSEDGIIYLFEENFGNWHLNEEATIKDVFFTNILKLDISKYLLMDIEGKLNLLDIDGINTPEDLWNLPLYQ